MAEIVEYRLEKTVDELNLLLEFGLFNKEHVKEILAKRENYEYVLRRRNRTKLDYLKYIKFEINLLESIEKYRKRVISDYYKSKKANTTEELDRKILLLQAKKLNDVVRSRSAHVSSLFRKLITSFQFDKKLWLAYIEFAKSRDWNTRVTSLYWRLLRVSGEDQDVWLAATSHEVNVNKAFDTARGLYLRAMRHHPKSSKIWAEYFKMELKFMEIIDLRARIVFQTTTKDKKDDEDIWVEKDTGVEFIDDEPSSETEEGKTKNDSEALPVVKPIDENDSIISGHLPKVIYNNATQSLDSIKEFSNFIIIILTYILEKTLESKGLISVKDHICEDIRRRRSENDLRISKDLADGCENLSYLKEYAANTNSKKGDFENPKRLKKNLKSKMDILYECYETEGLEATRKMFKEFEKSVKDQTLSLYVGMIQVESWQLVKDKSESQLKQIRSIFDKALMKFGQVKPKLWYEYLQFENEHAKSLKDFERIHQLYIRAQLTLHPSKVDRVIDKYTLIQVNSPSADLEYSDYSDLED